MKQIVELQYTVNQVAKYLNIPESKLRYWIKVGLCLPSFIKNGKLLFSFTDIVWIKKVKELTEQGVKPQIIRKAKDKYSETLSSIRLDSKYGRLIIKDEDGNLIEFSTGQLLLNFETEVKKEGRISFISEKRKDKNLTAEELFLKGYEMEHIQKDWNNALKYYKESLEKDPKFLPAYINIGNIYYKLGYPEEAKLFYTKAISLDSEDPQASYNLGYVLYEEGNFKEAIKYFEITIKNDPYFPDPYFHIGFCYEEIGEFEKAIYYWNKYLEFDSEGPWAEIIKFFLDKECKGGDKDEK